MKSTEKELRLAEELYYQDHGRYITTESWADIGEFTRRSYVRLAKCAMRFLRNYDPKNPPPSFCPKAASKNFSAIVDAKAKEHVA